MTLRVPCISSSFSAAFVSLQLNNTLGKNISHWFLRCNVRNRDVAFKEVISDKMTVHFNSLCSFVVDMIAVNMDCTSIITIERNMGRYQTPEIIK